MLKHVVWHLIKYGTDTMVEGVGYVSIDGKKQGDDEEWSGIDISCDDSEFDFEVERY